MNIWATKLLETKQQLAEFNAYVIKHRLEEALDTRDTRASIEAAVAEYRRMAGN